MIPDNSGDDHAARRRRIEALFDQVLDLAPAERAGVLARVGLSDPELRRDLEALLAAADQSGVTAGLARVVERLGQRPLVLPAPGSTVAQYELVEPIGGGGMGLVYKAWDPQLQRFVALKFLPKSPAADPELKLRFLQEATTIASLDHPSLCTVFEVAEPEAGQLVIVMPYYEGETLKQKIARGPLPVPEALDYALQVAEGLVHAHTAGVVHRDIKPANVVVTPGGRVKILDFGIAKVARADANLTRTGAVLGTLSYMSPEQAYGDRVDHRTDLWAAGVMLYEMLAGRLPFTGESLEALFHAIQQRHPERLRLLRPEVPPALESLVHRLLEKEPGRRPEDAGALVAALESVRDGGPALTTMGGDGETLERARAHFARSAWRDAYEAFGAADTAGELGAPDLERLAEAAWWLSKGDACIRARERAYRQYVQRREPRAAAQVALALAEDYFHRLARSVGQGWLRRAEQHLDGLPETLAHGWLNRLKGMIALDAERKPEEAIRHVDRALDIARRLGDRDLQALALQDRGRVLVTLGRVNEGMALVDEAMTAVAAGELTPRTIGRAYCNMISTCERLGDYGRAAEWHAAADGWCEPHADSGYPGICRVHQAGILRLRGALAEAEQQARRAANELAEFLSDVAGEAYYELGEIRRRLGDLAAAGQMFSEAHARGRDPQPGLALLRLAEGKPEIGRSMIARALGELGSDALDRAKLLPAAVQLSLACGDVEKATEAVLELETITTTYTSPALVAWAALAHGRVELAQGNAGAAILYFRRACRIWTEISLPVELAETRQLLSRTYAALGNAEEAEMEEWAARMTLDQVVTGNRDDAHHERPAG